MVTCTVFGLPESMTVKTCIKKKWAGKGEREGEEVASLTDSHCNKQSVGLCLLKKKLALKCL